MRLPLSLIAMTMLPTVAVTQPYSESMADCAALYQNAAQWVETQDKVDRLMYAARVWHAAAVDQSGAEGRPVSESLMWEKIDGKTEAWEAKGGTFFFTQEFRDWTDYCRGFAEHTGVEPGL